ncbi:hypothetical protein FRC12_023921 [Ceratobasidium sp. 428]|nr:hypothetical protein FRC12_023921 [Ceratobasidium sp. 428]
MALPRLISRTPSTTQRGLKQSSGDSLSSSQNPLLRDAPRNRHIFPGGFGNPEQAKNPPVEFTLPQLEDILIKQHSPNDHVEHIYMKSAQYCKEYDKPQREFILITVETAEDPRFSNFLVLDRTSSASDRTDQAGIVSMVSSSVSPSKPRDRIRISYDGSLKPLINYCGFSKYTVLETLEFQSASFRLYEMVALARAASESHRGYSTISNSCQWYTSLVWDCTRQLVPTATHTQNNERSFRGRFNNLFRQRIDFMELSTVSGSVGAELNALRQEFVSLQQSQSQNMILFQEQQRDELLQMGKE